MKRVGGIALGVMVWALAGTVAAAGQDAGQATTTLRVSARLVVLDVTVTDRDGKPVNDLGKDDFHVFEDGKPQTVRFFETPAQHELPGSAGEDDDAALAETFDPGKPANFGRAPVTVLVLDQLNTRFSDSSFARRQLAEFVNKQPRLLAQPTTLVTLSEGHFQPLTPFTRDRGVLQAALAKAPVKYSWTMETGGRNGASPVERLDTSLRALEEMAQSYARVPGRKNLIWVGGGFPAIDPESVADKDYREIRDTLKHVNEELLTARVTLFAVDPTSMAAGMTEITNFQQMAMAQLAGSVDATNIDAVDQGGDFDSLAAVSGGVVIRNLNNVSAQIGMVASYSRNFYTLAYAPTNTSEAALQFRQIHVALNRTDLRVTARTGYYAGRPAVGEERDRMSYDLSTALDSKMPMNGLQVSVEPDPSVAVPNDGWLVRVAAPGLTWNTADDGSSTAKVEILAASVNRQGKTLGHVLHSGSATARAGVNLSDPGKMAVFNFTAQADAKAATVRFVVRDAASGRMGTFDVVLR